MNLGPVFCGLRLVVVALLALAFIASPLAETAHAAQETSVCLVDHQTDASSSPFDEQGPTHDHKAHHCGGCHHHVWRIIEPEPFVLTSANNRYRLLPDDATLSAPPFELLRPPRA